MNIEDIRTYCLSKKGSSESFPFDDDTLVFKVLDKIFALTGITSDPLSINLKCEPERTNELREQYPCVAPGYHMNKKHWNTITLDGSVSNNLVKQWIDDSYNLVLNSLTRKQKEELNKF